MLNRDVLYRDPTSYTLANDGVAKVAFPPPPEMLEVLRGELDAFVCDGAYAAGLTKLLEAFNAAAGRKGSVPAVWISGFYGSGKSHLAAMLAALWTNLTFPNGATAEGMVHDKPKEVASALRELRANAARMGGTLAGGDTLGFGSKDPVEAVLAVILKAAGLPTNIAAARICLWLDSENILDAVRIELGAGFDRAVRRFLLSEQFAQAVLKAKPSLSPDIETLRSRLGTQFGGNAEPTVDLLVEMGRDALLIGRKEIPLTLIVLDEVQQFIREDPSLTLKIQTIAEQLCSRFDGRVLLVCTGQQALSDTKDLQKLLGRFSVQVPLGSADIDTVIRKTVLRKKDENAKRAVANMLDARSGEIHRHLAGTKLAHGPADREDAVADWPILPTRRRLWERVLRELDKTGLGGTLRGQLRTSLDAVKQYGDRPLGYAIPVDFLYGRFADEAFSRNLLSRETRDRIDLLRAQQGDGPLKARILMIVYLLSRIEGEAMVHGVLPTEATIADLLIEDLGDTAVVRGRVSTLLAELQAEVAVIEVGGEWRLQTKESADWQQAFSAAQAAEINDANGIGRTRASLLQQAIDTALTGATQVAHGVSKTQRRIERAKGNAKQEGEGLLLRLWNEWDDPIATTEKDVAAGSVSDATLHLLIPAVRAAELRAAIVTVRAADAVIQQKGIPTTEGGKLAKTAMESRREKADATARACLAEAVAKARVLLSGGAEIGVGQQRADAVKEAATRVLDRLYPQFATGDHAAWDKVITQARKKVPDAMKEVGHPGDAQDHAVCKAFLKALTPVKKGSDLRNLFAAVPYGWPKEAVDAAGLALANAGQVKVTGPDGKLVVLADLNASQFGPCTFAPETRIVTTAEKLAVRGLGTALGLPVPANEELAYLVPIVDRLAQISAEAGGAAPAPEPPMPPGLAEFRNSSGNDLLAALGAKAAQLRPLIEHWRKDKAEIAARLSKWRLAESLIELGAEGQRQALDAVRSHRSLLTNPDPISPIIAAAAENLREQANRAYAACIAAWEAGEERLKADPSWTAVSPEKKHQFRQAHGLGKMDPPDLSTPEKIAESLRARGLSEWRSMANALPKQVEDALQDAAIELEPKTQPVPIPRRTLKSEADLETWLTELRDKIAPCLSLGPVLPTI